MSNQGKQQSFNLPILLGVLASIVTILGFFGITRFPLSWPWSSDAGAPFSTFPVLASAYNGTITNASALNYTAHMSLSLVQNQGTITGNLTFSDGLDGSGPFEGTVGSDKSVHFVVNGTYHYKFSGEILSDHSIRGNFTSDLPDQGGTWEVTPS